MRGQRRLDRELIRISGATVGRGRGEVHAVDYERSAGFCRFLPLSQPHASGFVFDPAPISIQPFCDPVCVDVRVCPRPAAGRRPLEL